MPPPKKPKQGRTSLEQFLSEEEKSLSRNFRDSEGNSPSHSVEDGSDGETFVTSKSIYNDTRLKAENDGSLFHKLFYKSNVADEQKIHRCPREELSSPTSSPQAGCVQVEAFKKYYDNLRLKLEKQGEMEQSIECVSAKNESDIDMCDRPFQHSQASEVIFSNEHGRLIDSLVASALASTAAQSIIYGSAPTPVFAPIQKYTAINGLTFSNCTTVQNLGNEPHDLSKKSEENGSILNKILNENIKSTNINDTDRISNIYRELARRQNNEISSECSKQNLESQGRTVGLLSERSAEDGQQIPGRKTDILVNSVPTRYSNGIFARAKLNGILNYQQYDNHQRESLDRSVLNVDDSAACLMSPGSYLPIHPMMSPSGPISQSPTSTTLDHVEGRDRFHPVLMNTHYLSDDRRTRHETTQGGSVNKLCQVCSDNASGFHYGVWSCEGCKAFFKRSIQGPVDYVCPATNTCTIDKHRRKSCQACRLRKCYEVGMNKGSQRKERKAASATQNKALKRPRDLVDGMNNDVDSSPSLVKNSRKSRASIFIAALRRADVPNLQCYHNPNLPPNRQHLLTSFVKLAERELEFLICWSKNVPGYTELSLNDQTHMIECCWMEIILLKCAFRSMEHGGNILVIASDFMLEREHWTTIGMADILEQVAAVSKQLGQHGLHNDELLLLQATILVNAEVRDLESFNKLNDIRRTILDSVVDIAQKYHPDNLRHIPSLLLLLAHIRHASVQAIRYFQSVKNEGIVAFCLLLSEML